MLIYRSDDFIGNIYTSKFVNGKWTPLVKLNENINTKYWESHASFSMDGKTLYFSSNRRGGYGGLDIYRSEKQPNGEWGIPVNLGPAINTKYNDDTPFITEAGDKLYFSSYGHYNIGGYDIFMSRKKTDGTWAEPVNIGYPINTTDDDQFFYPIKNGEIAYYSRYDSQEGFGRHDIFRYKVYTPDNPRLFAIKGLLDYQGIQVNPEEIKISVVNPLTADTLKRLHPEVNGSFTFKTPAGKYEMIFDSKKFHKKIVPLEVSPDTPREGLVLTNPIILEMLPPALPVEELEKLLSIREDSIIYAKENEKVSIRYNAEKDSEVIIQVYNEGRLISSDTLNADRRRQSFEFKPLPGENEVKIIVTDQDGNTITKKVKVITPSSLPSETSEDSTGDQTEVLGEGPESESGQDRRLTTLDEKVQSLRENSSPELKEYLDKLDLEAEGIKSEKDLINHLFAASEKEGFSRDQLIDALSRAGLLSDLDIFIRDLAGVSSPRLQKYLLELNTTEEGIANESELIRHLFENAGENTYDRQDVVDALNKLNASREMKILMDELKNHTQGALLEYLSTLDPAENAIYSLEDLQNHLMENAAKNGFTKDDVMHMFQSFFNENQDSTKVILEKMIKNAEGENLEFLKNFREAWNETMNNRQGFYDNLFESTNKQGLKTEDIVSLALEAENVSLPNLKDHMLRFGSPDLQNAVMDHPASLRTGKELYDYLSKLSVEDKSVDQKEVTDLAKDYLSNKDLYDLYYSMIRNSEGKLREYLQSLDIKNSGISSAEDLIKHLFNVSSDQGFSHDDIYNALNKANSEAYINQMISDLIQLAEGNIKTSLEALNPDVEGIQSLQDILRYLLNNKDRFGYNEQDVYDLIRRYLSRDHDIIGVSEDTTDSITAVKEKFNRGVKITAGILLLEGLLIFILILLARRKKKKDKNA
ncbi:MAG: PD40 domain-containing protein [Bacteroidales bacterium]|nr:PD40 domain-containing protein [Bacteroidales bacterium]